MVKYKIKKNKSILEMGVWWLSLDKCLMDSHVTLKTDLGTHC